MHPTTELENGISQAVQDHCPAMKNLLPVCFVFMILVCLKMAAINLMKKSIVPYCILDVFFQCCSNVGN